MSTLDWHTPPERVLVHLSDTHLLKDNAPLAGVYDTEQNVQATFDRIALLGDTVDAVIVTGDLTDLGEPEAYRELRRRAEPLAARLDAPIVWVMGNHDERPAMRTELLGERATFEPVTAVVDVGGLRVIALDSTVPGWHHGELGAEQLDWLRRELRTPAPLGTLLALHHPPLANFVPFFDILALQDQDAFAEVVRGSDVRGILAGHLHYATAGMFAGVPVSVASASCYTIDIAPPPLFANGMDAGQSYQLIHVWADSITHSVVPVYGAEASEYFSPDWYAQFEGLTEAQRRERYSRKR